MNSSLSCLEQCVLSVSQMPYRTLAWAMQCVLSQLCSKTLGDMGMRLTDTLLTRRREMGSHLHSTMQSLPTAGHRQQPQRQQPQRQQLQFVEFGEETRYLMSLEEQEKYVRADRELSEKPPCA